MSNVTPKSNTKMSTVIAGNDADFETSVETLMSPQKIATPPFADKDDFSDEKKDSKTFSISSLVNVDLLTNSNPKSSTLEMAGKGPNISPSASKTFLSPDHSPIMSAAVMSSGNSPNSEQHANSGWSEANIHAAAARFNALRLSGGSYSNREQQTGISGRHSFFAGSISNSSLETASNRIHRNSFTYAPISEGASTAPFASIVPPTTRIDYGGAAWNGASTVGVNSQKSDTLTSWTPLTRSDSFSVNPSRYGKMNGERGVENGSSIPENMSIAPGARGTAKGLGTHAGSNNEDSHPAGDSMNGYLNPRMMSAASGPGFNGVGRRSTLQPGNTNIGLPGVVASLESNARRHSIDFEAAQKNSFSEFEENNGLDNDNENAKLRNGKNGSINANGDNFSRASGLKNNSELAVNTFQSSLYEPSPAFHHSLAAGQSSLLNQKGSDEALTDASGLRQPLRRRFSHADVSSVASLTRTDSGSQPERDHPLKDVGKGVPLSSLPPMSKLWVVEFKAGRSDVYYSVGSANGVFTVGDLVIVEGDRGKDLGKIMSEITPQELLELQARQHPALDFVHMTNREIHPRILYRRAHNDEIKHLMIKNEDEERSLKFIRSRVSAHNLDMHVIDSEYQFDRRKLTFYFVSSERVDFRNLIQELFKIYKTRIWLCSVNGLPTAAATNINNLSKISETNPYALQ